MTPTDMNTLFSFLVWACLTYFPLTSGRICATTELAILFMLWSALSPSLLRVSWAPSCKQGTLTSWCALTDWRLLFFVCRGRLSYCPTDYLKILSFLTFYKGTKGVFVLYDFAAISLFNLQFAIHTTYWNFIYVIWNCLHSINYVVGKPPFSIYHQNILYNYPYKYY